MRVTLGDFLYVGLGLNTEDRNLKLIVPECKATPDPDRNSEPQYYFIDQKYVRVTSMNSLCSVSNISFLLCAYA